MRLEDVREWGETPEIEVLEDGSWQVTFYDQVNEKVTFHIPLPKYPGHEMNGAIIRNTGEVYCDWK